MSPIDYSQPIDGNSQRSGASAVPKLVWALIAVIAVMALAIGYLLGTRNGEDGEGQGLAQPAASASTAAGADADSSDEGDGATDEAASASGALNVAAPKVGTGAQLWGPGVEPTKLTEIGQVHRRVKDDPFAVGKVDAPVVISEFSDFECPFCSRHVNQVEPKIMEYVEDGKVRIEWNDFPVNGPYAVDSAKAGRAAAEQGKFAEYKDVLYAASKGVSGHPEYTIDDFVGFAKEAGVKDLDKFRADATSDKYDEAVKNATAYASGIGITGTPAFVIGETFISGAQPEETFVDTIEKELSKAGAA